LVLANSDRPAQPEFPAVRTYFYVGGGYADDGSGGHIFKDQMYVEKLSPVSTKRKQPNPIVFIHGQGQTGANFLNKPDGGKSWSSRFLEAGIQSTSWIRPFVDAPLGHLVPGHRHHRRIPLSLFSSDLLRQSDIIYGLNLRSTFSGQERASWEIRHSTRSTPRMSSSSPMPLSSRALYN
jgi:hypothetical protein